jgi:hypothetical protein
MFHARTRHKEVDYHFVHERVANTHLEIQFISTHDQIADGFKKPLTTRMLKYFSLKNPLNPRRILRCFLKTSCITWHRLTLWCLYKKCHRLMQSVTFLHRHRLGLSPSSPTKAQVLWRKKCHKCYIAFIIDLTNVTWLLMWHADMDVDMAGWHWCWHGRWRGRREPMFSWANFQN